MVGPFEGTPRRIPRDWAITAAGPFVRRDNSTGEWGFVLGPPPMMKSIPFNSQSPPRRLWALVSLLVAHMHL